MIVKPATSFSRNGVADWLVQRFTAVVLAAYTIYLLAFLVMNPGLEYETWKALFDNIYMRVFSLLSLLSLAAHSWIGLWGVLTDYVTERLMGSKALGLRAIVLFVYAIVTVAYVVWGIEILWGIK